MLVPAVTQSLRASDAYRGSASKSDLIGGVRLLHCPDSSFTLLMLHRPLPLQMRYQRTPTSARTNT
jgi:hypothetical protein